MRLSVLRPLNRAVKFQASGSIRRLNSLAANRVFQTEAYNLRGFRFGGRSQQRRSYCNLCAEPQCPEPSDLIQRRESREALTNSRPNRQASEVSNEASAAIAVKLSQPLNLTLRLRAALIRLALQSRLSSCNLYAELGSLQNFPVSFRIATTIKKSQTLN
jgi:hypothetical protein